MISHRKSKEVINIAWFGHTSFLLLKKKWHKTDIFPILQKLTHMAMWPYLVEKEKTWDLWSLAVMTTNATAVSSWCHRFTGDYSWPDRPLAPVACVQLIFFSPLSQVQEVSYQDMVQQGVPAVEQGEAQGVLSEGRRGEEGEGWRKNSERVRDGENGAELCKNV